MDDETGGSPRMEYRSTTTSIVSTDNRPEGTCKLLQLVDNNGGDATPNLF